MCRNTQEIQDFSEYPFLRRQFEAQAIKYIETPPCHTSGSPNDKSSRDHSYPTHHQYPPAARDSEQIKQQVIQRLREEDADKNDVTGKAKLLIKPHLPIAEPPSTKINRQKPFYQGEIFGLDGTNYHSPSDIRYKPPTRPPPFPRTYPTELGKAGLMRTFDLVSQSISSRRGSNMVGLGAPIESFYAREKESSVGFEFNEPRGRTRERLHESERGGRISFDYVYVPEQPTFEKGPIRLPSLQELIQPTLLPSLSSLSSTLPPPFPSFDPIMHNSKINPLTCAPNGKPSWSYYHYEHPTWN